MLKLVMIEGKAMHKQNSVGFRRIQPAVSNIRHPQVLDGTTALELKFTEVGELVLRLVRPVSLSRCDVNQ